jgi:hypothetical protein
MIPALFCGAPEPRIAGAIHVPHAPGAERGEDFVGTEAGPDTQRASTRRPFHYLGAARQTPLLTV